MTVPWVSFPLLLRVLWVLSIPLLLLWVLVWVLWILLLILLLLLWVPLLILLLLLWVPLVPLRIMFLFLGLKQTNLSTMAGTTVPTAVFRQQVIPLSVNAREPVDLRIWGKRKIRSPFHMRESSGIERVQQRNFATPTMIPSVSLAPRNRQMSSLYMSSGQVSPSVRGPLAAVVGPSAHTPPAPSRRVSFRLGHTQVPSPTMIPAGPLAPRNGQLASLYMSSGQVAPSVPRPLVAVVAASSAHIPQAPAHAPPGAAPNVPPVGLYVPMLVGLVPFYASVLVGYAPPGAPHQMAPYAPPVPFFSP